MLLGVAATANASGVISAINPDTTAPGDKNTNNETDTNQSDQLPATGTNTLGIGAFTLAMLCCGAALGVLLRRRTRN